MVGFTSSSSMSDSSDTNTPRSHCSRRSGGQIKRSSQAGWTDKEDTMLTELVKKYNGKNWKKIAETIPGRSDVQCLHRWQKVINPALFKGPWTKEEDDCIRELVEKHGCKKWSFIAKHLAGRIGKQCRERWHNHLNPAIKRDAWTDDEEVTLAYCHQMYGNRWSEIARFLPGRSDNAIKNHWNVTKKNVDLNTPPAFSNGTTSAEFSTTKKRSRETSLTLSIPGFNEGGSQTIEKHLVSETPCYGYACYQQPKLKNLTSSLENDGSGSGSPTTSNSFRQSNCQISCSTPLDLTLSISINNSSPKAILRKSGLSYKNTPSIIRKRPPRKTVDHVETSGSYSWLHRSQACLGRRLDYVFNDEWDPTMLRCCTPGSVTSSSKANAMLTL